MKNFENEKVKVIFSDDLRSSRLIPLVQKHKEFGKNTLWIPLSGIYTIVDSKIYEDCTTCKSPFYFLNDPESSEALKEIADMANSMCATVQKTLGSDGLIAIVPPIPALVAQIDGSAVSQLDGCSIHQRLHIQANYRSIPITNRRIYSQLHKVYNEYCQLWGKLAYNRLAKWMKVGPFQKFIHENRWNNLIPTTSKGHRITALDRWHDMMEDFFNLILVAPFRDSVLMYPANSKYSGKESETEGNFEQVVVLGPTKLTQTLQKLTVDMPVVHLDQCVEFDEDGLSVLNKEKTKFPARTLWIVLSGVSAVAEKVDEGLPSCKMSSCSEPMPAFVTRNHASGDPDYKDMSIEQMVNSIVKQAFDFAMVSTQQLKEGSALFLAPIIPLRTIWAGHATCHSHSELHSMYKQDASIPFLVGRASDWVKCAKDLESRWLEVLIMKNLPKGSAPYNLCEKYIKEKPPVLEYVSHYHDVNLNKPRKTWSMLMSDMIKFYLGEMKTNAPAKPDVIDQKVQEEFERGGAPVGPFNQGEGPPSFPNPMAPNMPRPPGNDMPQNFPHPQYPQNHPSYPQNPTPYPQNPTPYPQNPTPYPQNPTSYPQNPSPYLQNPSPYPKNPTPYPQNPTPYPQNHAPYPQNPSPYPQNLPPTDPWPPHYGPGWPSSSPAQSLPLPSMHPTSFLPSVSSVTTSVNASCTVQAPPKLNPVSSMKTSVKPGPTIQALPRLNPMMKGHLVIQNGETDFDEIQAKTLFQEFGEIGDFKWPRKQNVELDGPAGFVIVNFNNRKDADRAERILNFLKVFGDKAEVKLIGGNQKDTTALESEDFEKLISIHEILNMIKNENKKPKVQAGGQVTTARESTPSVSQVASATTLAFPTKPEAVVQSKPKGHTTMKFGKLPTGTGGKKSTPSLSQAPKITHTISVSDFTEIVPMDVVSQMFVELGALEKGFLIADALHFDFHGDARDLKVLSGFRFPDKKMSIEINGPDRGVTLSPLDVGMAKGKIKSPMSKLMNEIGRVLKEKVDNEMNVYTFKTRLCEHADHCQEKVTCHGYHIEGDRRRCPIKFKYSDVMCADMEVHGFCDSMDGCPRAHSMMEVLFHFNRYRSIVCQGWKSDGVCNKTGFPCSFSHPGTPDLLYNDSWENVYVEGLKKTMDFLTAAIMNLFLFPRLPCVRVLLVTPSPELAKLYVQCFKDLAKSCSQKLTELTGKTIEDGTTVLIATLDSLLRFMPTANLNKSRHMDVSRMKAIVLDDWPGIFKKMPKYKKDFFIQYGSNGVNLVATAETIEDGDIEEAWRHLRPQGGFRKVYVDPDRNKGTKDQTSGDLFSLEPCKEDSPLDKRPSSKKLTAAASSRSGSYKEDSPPVKRSSSKETRDDHTSSTLRSDVRNRSSPEADSKYSKAKRELEEEHDRELELYIETPEVHPDYEEKYSIFIDDYKHMYPGRHNMEHSDLQWQLFWKDEITTSLKKEYDMKRKALDVECVTIRERSSEYSKRKSSTDDGYRQKEKYRRDERASDISQRETDGRSSQRKRFYHREDEVEIIERKSSRKEERGYKDVKTSNLNRSERFRSNRLMQTSDVSDELSLEEILSVMDAVCPALGILGPILQLLNKRIEQYWSDKIKLRKILNDDDNKLILKRVSEKTRELSEVPGSGPLGLKFKLASAQALKLLEFSTASLTKQNYYGLDLEAITRATYNKDPNYIIQYIRNKLSSRGVDDASDDAVNDIYALVMSAQFDIAGGSKPEENPRRSEGKYFEDYRSNLEKRTSAERDRSYSEWHSDASRYVRPDLPGRDHLSGRNIGRDSVECSWSSRDENYQLARNIIRDDSLDYAHSGHRRDYGQSNLSRDYGDSGEMNDIRPQKVVDYNHSRSESQDYHTREKEYWR